jgi:IS30 family transposase
MICPNCGKSTALRDYNPKEYKIRKAENAKASAVKAKLNGNKTGPPRLRDDNKIRKLRSKGLSLRKIGKMLGLNHNTIKRSLDEVAKGKGE